MKVVVIGATGRCGAHAARACLKDERVTKVFVIARRAPDEDIAQSGKVEVILHQDFESWPDDLMTKLDGVEACLWAVGGRVDQLNGDKVYCRKVNVVFTLSFAEALQKSVLPTLPAGKHFRFVFCSGSYAEWDQKKRLLFLSDTRKIKGEVEQKLCEMADQEEGPGGGRWETYLLRPMGLQDEKTPGPRRWFMRSTGFGIETDEVGRMMERIAVEGWGKRILENEEIIKAAAQ